VLLRKLYDNYFELNRNSEIDRVLGGVLYREEEDYIAYTDYQAKVEWYLKFHIQKFFGLNLREFMKLYHWEYRILFKEAKKKMEELDKNISNMDLLKEIEE